MESNLQCKALSDRAILPTRGSQQAAGLDLYASESTIIKAQSFGAVSTDIAVAIPQGYYGRVAPRSGMSFKNGIDVLAGVVDSDYRGEVKVALANHAGEDFIVNPGDRIAQLVIEKIIVPKPEWVAGELPQTDRGQDGFGSTGT